MKILVSGHETCGVIHDLAEELESRGHDVTTVAMRDPFFEYTYDYEQYDFLASFLSRKYGVRRMWSTALATLWRARSDWHEILEKKLRLQLVNDVDLYLRVWAHIPFDGELLESLVKKGVRIATLFMGSDVRDWNVFKQQYCVAYPLPENHRSLADKLDDLRMHERYADAIFSVPDQMGLALRPYHHLQVPVKMTKFGFNVPGRDVPKVVHAPSVPTAKGTDRIEAALETLRDEGHRFEFVSLRNRPHAEVLETLSDADLLVDELVGHGPAWLSFEAMASGCAVATRYLTDSPACFRPPVVPIDDYNLVEQLRALLSNRDRRITLGGEGRRYVEANNRIDHVVDVMLDKIAAGRAGEHDYRPRFLCDEYVPASAEEARVINAANVKVSRETWYHDHVRGHSHDGLVF